MSVSGRDPDVQGREVVAGGRVKHPNAADTKPRSGARDGNSSKKAPEKMGEVWQKICPVPKKNANFQTLRIIDGNPANQWKPVKTQPNCGTQLLPFGSPCGARVFFKSRSRSRKAWRAAKHWDEAVAMASPSGL